MLTSDGRIVVGCNVENASYGLTVCAERVAICSAIAQGCSSFSAICVSLAGVPVPCGACRQFLFEFNPEMFVLLDDVNSTANTVRSSFACPNCCHGRFGSGRQMNHNEAALEGNSEDRRPFSASMADKSQSSRHAPPSRALNWAT